MENLLTAIREAADGTLNGVSDGVIIAMAVVSLLIVVAGIVALVINIMLFFKYNKFNGIENSYGMTGEEVARKVLDEHDLKNIKVTCTGSFIFGNSYSHYFHRVRLRRFTWQKTSITAMAMAIQKASLAVLDKNGDKDMRKRVKLTPLVYFGPIAAIPMIFVGLLIDYMIFHTIGLCTILFTVAGFAFYMISFILSVLELKTEIKAQQYALTYMAQGGEVSSEEIGMCKELFKLYNIEYINNMIIALLEILLRVLEVVAKAQSAKSSSSK